MTDHDEREDRESPQGFDRDDATRALLRSGDPASALPPLSADTMRRLVEQAVSGSPATPSAGPSAPARRGVGTWLVAAAAAAVVVTAGVGAVHNAMSDDTETVSQAPPSTAPTDPAPSATSVPASPSDSSTTGSTTASTTVLTVTDAAFDARCAVPSASTLQAADTAFAGTVTSIEGNRVQLQRSSTYRGSVADTVVVRAPARDLSRLVQTVRFKVGDSYLVSASDGQVALCGFSGPAQPRLQGIYTEAFPS